MSRDARIPGTPYLQTLQPPVTMNTTPGAQGFQAPMLLRPDLVGVFDASAHAATDFNFAPIPKAFSQPWTRRAKPRSKDAKKRRAEHKKEGAEPNKEGTRRLRLEDTTAMGLSPMATFKLKCHLAHVERDPRKKRMLAPSNPDDDETAVFDDEENDLSLDLWDAKASIRNHLLNASPVRTAATKRRVNGHERNWIRAHKLDDDVKYLMQFPGEMRAEKARDLIMKRDMLSLDVVEEADGSLVMPTETLSEASHISEASRIEKLEMATNKILDRLAVVEAEMAALPGEEEAESVELEGADEKPESIASNTSPDDHQPLKQHSDEIDVSVTPSPLEKVESVASDASTEDKGHSLKRHSDDEDAHADLGASPPKKARFGDEEAGELVTMAAVDETSGPENSHSERPSSTTVPETPKTPQINGSQEIVDVDLHKQSDIFASVMPKRHHEFAPAIPAQPSWLAAATPQPLSSPAFSFNLNGQTPAQWSPMVFTPAQAFRSESSSSPISTSEMLESPSVQRTEMSVEAAEALAPVTPMDNEQTTSVVSTSPEMVQPSEVAKSSAAPPTEPFVVAAERPVSFTPVNIEVSSAPSTPPKALETEEQQEEVPQSAVVTITVSSPEITAKAESPAQDDDDRTFLLQFMNKHHAVKSKVGAASPGARPMPDSPAAQEPVPTTIAAPQTPDAAPIRVWADAPEVTRGGDAESPVKAPAAQSHLSKRMALGKLDTNSPSPVKARVGKRKLDDEPAEDETNKSKDADKEAASEPSPKRRRGLRARKPVAPSTPIPANARAIRSGEKDLAALTRANTRANKGNAVPPEEVLERFAADPMGQKWKERKEVVDAKAARAASASVLGRTRAATKKNVQWAQTLAQYREGSPLPEEVQEEVKEEPVIPNDAPQKKQRAPRGKQAASATATAIPKAAPKSKLPAPVTKTKRTASNTSATTKIDATAKDSMKQVKDSRIAKPRPTRAAAQKSNINMGLTATGTPIRRARGRPAKASQ